MNNVTLNQLLERINREVAALPIHSVRELKPALHEVKVELERDLSKLLTRDIYGETWTAKRYSTFLVQVKGALSKVRELDGDVSEVLREGAIRSARLVEKHVAEEFNLLGGERMVPDVRFAAALAEGRRALYRRFETSAARYAGEAERDIKRQFAVGILKGETIDQLTRRIASLANFQKAHGENGFTEVAASLTQRITWKAERLVRTEVINGYNAQFMDGIRELAKTDEELLVRWDAAIDRRTCPVCRDLDGRIVKPGQLFDGIYEHPPAHPSCRCAATSWKESWGTTRETATEEAA